MTRFKASRPSERRALLAEAVTAHRNRGSEATVFEAGHHRVRYTDRVVQFDLSEEELGRLRSLLEEFPVFKIKQPETRKAETGIVYVSAIADAKHAADFLDAAFRDVFDCADAYELRVIRV